MAGGRGGETSDKLERELDRTPTWVVAVVCAVIIIISIALEKILHQLGVGGLPGAKKFSSTETLIGLLKKQKELNRPYGAICASPGWCVYGGHYDGEKTAARILQAGFFWPILFKDAHQFVLKCDRCQRVGNMSKKDEMPLNVLLEVEVFNVWRINFMGPFVSPCNNQYILLAVDYVSKWVEVKVLPINDAKVVLNFLHKQIFTRFVTLRVIISDKGSYFCNRKFTAMMQRYNVNHRIATAYHPQNNGQVEVSNGVIKRILEKVACPSRKDWSLKLDEAVWAYRKKFKTPLGMSLFHLVYGKGYHLAVELEHKAYWALKKLNLDLDTAGKKMML
ncbi:hypothetical protein AgCh_036511 [Apium graveolens]